MMKFIAFYLPQYHKSIENDKWWGNNFTEWTKVKEAKKYFDFQVQPKIPLNSNYYDITNEDTIKWQIDLAKQYSLYGFCLYHYWSNGKRLLGDGIDSFLTHNDNFPFSFCWANHNWTREWQGKGNQILFKQDYSISDIKLHANWLANKVFSKSNYIRIDGKLLFTIFSIYNLPNAKDFISIFRDEVRKYDEELHIVSMLKTNEDSLISQNIGIDGFIVRQPYLKCSLIDGLNVIPYHKIMDDYIYDYQKSNNLEIPNIFNTYDNSPRREKFKSLIVKDTSPELFKAYLKNIISIRKKSNNNSELFFLTAWNEWGEGNYFEPCTYYNDEYLKVFNDINV